MATIDRIFQNLRTIFGTLRFFRHGWGANHTRHHPWLKTIKVNPPPAPTPPPITWKPVLSPLGFLSLGVFQSPSANFLPPESRLARFLYVPPRTQKDTPPPLVLLLPATGEHGFTRRVATLAWWLRLQGVASAILEGPFYGSRRPKGQRGGMLDYVDQLPDLGRATIEESLSLLSYFRKRGFAKLAVAGVSQGGLHAAMVASLSERPLPVVMGCSPHSAVPVFTEGVLARAVDWEALGGDGKEKLKEVLKVSDINNFPRPKALARHVLLFAKSDCYITSDSVTAWKAARPHVQIEWVSGGHVTAALLSASKMRTAILDVLSTPTPH